MSGQSNRLDRGESCWEIYIHHSASMDWGCSMSSQREAWVFSPRLSSAIINVWLSSVVPFVTQKMNNARLMSVLKLPGLIFCLLRCEQKSVHLGRIYLFCHVMSDFFFFVNRQTEGEIWENTCVHLSGFATGAQRSEIEFPTRPAFQCDQQSPPLNSNLFLFSVKNFSMCRF